jgi:hypothetical protein
MDNALTPLEIIKSQRDSLAVAYHDLQVELALLKNSLTQTNQLLEMARARIFELETPATGFVKIASHAATDAAA